MGGYHVVPQHAVNILAPALSSDDNTGRVIAETVLRDPAVGLLIQKMHAGVTLDELERAQLPPLMPGHNWDEIAASFRAIHAANDPQGER